MMISRSTCLTISLVCISLVLGACSGRGSTVSAKQECEQLLQLAEKEYEKAKADTLADAGLFTKVSVILTDGSLAKQFGGYQKCIRKAQRARELLRPYLNKAGNK